MGVADASQDLEGCFRWFWFDTAIASVPNRGCGAGAMVFVHPRSDGFVRLAWPLPRLGWPHPLVRLDEALWLCDELPLVKIGLSDHGVAGPGRLVACIDIPDRLVTAGTLPALAAAVDAAALTGWAMGDWIGRVEAAAFATRRAIAELEAPSDDACRALVAAAAGLIGWAADVLGTWFLTPSANEMTAQTGGGKLTVTVADTDQPAHPDLRPAVLRANWAMNGLAFSETAEGRLVCTASLPLAGASAMDVAAWLATVEQSAHQANAVLWRSLERWHQEDCRPWGQTIG